MVEEQPIPHIVLDVARVAVDDVLVPRFLEVVKDVAELHRPEAHERRTVRVAFLIGERVVLAVHRDPLLRGDPRRQPERQAEQPGHGRMQDERSMRRRAMQEDRGAEDGDLNEDGGDSETR